MCDNCQCILEEELWHELSLTFESKEKRLENLTLSGVSVSDAAVAQLAKCVSSGASYPMQDLRRTFRQHLTGPGQRYFTGIQEIIFGNFSKIQLAGEGEAD